MVGFHFPGSARILTGCLARVKAPPPTSNEQDHEGNNMLAVANLALWQYPCCSKKILFNK